MIFFDALRVKVRDEGLFRNKGVHIALGVCAGGTKESLGLWLEQNEGAKFWLRVMNELKNRGVEDVLIAVGGHFPSDAAAAKLLFLVLNRSEKQWIMPPREWSIAKSQFAVLFGERFTMAMA